MIKHTDEKIVAFMATLFNESGQSYAHYRCTVEENTDSKVRVTVSCMYEYVEYNLATLMKIATFFGTMKIDDDRYSHSGCETCDYGSSYEVTFEIKPE